MNRFITKKAEKSGIGNAVGSMFLLFWGLIFLAVVYDFLMEKDFSGAMVTLVMAGLNLFPFWRLRRRARLRKEAKHFATVLNQMDESEIPYEELDRVFDRKQAGKKLHRMIEAGYLRNVRMDVMDKYVELIPKATRKKKEPIYIQARCPSCGADNKINKQEGGSCAYCGSFLEGSVR